MKVNLKNIEVFRAWEVLARDADGDALAVSRLTYVCEAEEEEQAEAEADKNSDARHPMLRAAASVHRAAKKTPAAAARALNPRRVIHAAKLPKGFLRHGESLDDPLSPEEECQQLQTAAMRLLRQHPNYLVVNPPAPGAPPLEGVTLVTQFSLERATHFLRLVGSWDGPISAAVYASDAEAARLASMIADAAALAGQNNRFPIRIHILYRPTRATGADRGQLEPPYPVNRLRNLARERADTPWALLLDADFSVSHHLFKHTSRHVAKLTAGPVGAMKQALVIPAFETSQYHFSTPRTKV